MYNSSLLDILRVLDSSEMRALDKFLRSPYFNDGRNAERLYGLFQYIYPLISKPDSPKLAKAVVYPHLFGKEAVVKGKLEKLMSELLRLVRQFLVQEEWPKKDLSVEQYLVLTKFFQERRLDRFFHQTIEKLRRELRKAAPDKDVYLQQFQTERAFSDYNSLRIGREYDLDISPAAGHLNRFFVLTHLEYYVAQLTRQRFSKGKSSTALFIPEIIQTIAQGHFDDCPLIMLHYHLYYMLQRDDETRQHYQAFQLLLTEVKDQISREKLIQMHTHSRNYCIILLSEGQQSYLEELFRLYREHLHEGTLYYDGKLRPGTIKNIVQTGLQLGAHEWAIDFLRQHRNRIAATMAPEEVYQFNLAVCYFYQKALDKALDCLAPAYEDIYYGMAARRLEIKIFYEQQSVLLDAKMDAFKALIYRQSQKRLSNKQKAWNNHFIDLLRQIIHPKTLHNPKRILKLKDKINSFTYIFEKKWLLEKLAELE